MAAKINKIVLAYSGGLDTSVILKWLQEIYKADVVAFIADIGQGEETAPAVAKAKATGACNVYCEDLREEFVRDFVFPAMRANALYEGSYLLGTSVARPLIAKAQIDVLRKEQADAVAHGATGKGNDQVRFELTYLALEPSVTIIAPWRDPRWDLTSRTKMIEYARKHGIDVPVTVKKPYSNDRNLLHLSFEGGILEDPWAEPPADMFQLTVDPAEAPDAPTCIEVEFEEGMPVAVDGERLSPAALLARLNDVAGANGVGRVDMVENRFVGMKSRGVYETPGGTVLYAAHRAVESITMDREVMLQRDLLSPKIAQLIYNGFWYSPEMKALMAFVDASQQDVTGTARLKLYKGNCTVVGRKAPKSLYDEKISTFEEDQGAYQQADAGAFIRLNALRLRVRNKAGLL
ncbi:MAG TPA: argininosuccinate synthase [Candidatus Hydrogenedentes bacterium]|jgi:argininosuccinate synthase|nr:argininosuccinate synthase [Candidatus Hydrogenedentota bacterium]MDY0031198.1 argininosuccinate synthase [FCB group bacterium]NLT60435.1 argininosuccinate synthase [Candidatus Hydrogenedentota bacterium]HNV21681.1 argininosuccinate synthase [Candidatus Hydrogenedentota bacterium]HNZ19993.1 argininosuccinate synthase [Candidatus Hydrogenedentota bacterium]